MPIMRWLQFLLSHSIFIAFCAVALCWQTDIILHLEPDYWLYSFVLFSTLSSYNFYWLLSKYSFSGTSLPALIHKNRSYLFLFFVALLGMLVAFAQLIYLSWHILVAIILTLLYALPLFPFAFAKTLRKAGFIKTSLLAFTWSYVTVVLPSADNFFVADRVVLLLLAARFCFMLMLCSIFDRRDIKIDKMHGLHSLATDVGQHALKIIMIICFVGYLTAGILVRQYVADNWQLIAFCITAVILWIVYRLSLKKQGYHFYYFVVDGLMLLSAFLSFLASLAAN